jgi:hypothetical protein
MPTIEELLKKIEYLTVEQVENPKWELEDMHKIHPSLGADNYMTYVLFLYLRKHDLSPEEVQEYNKLIDVMKELENKEIEKAYGHFEIAQY